MCLSHFLKTLPFCIIVVFLLQVLFFFFIFSYISYLHLVIQSLLLLLNTIATMDNSVNNGRVSFDPGWNDPPKISFDPQQATPNRPRNFLNKRVAFPLSGGITSPAMPQGQGLPPITSGAPVSPMPQTMAPTSTPSICQTSLDSESVLAEVKSVLLEFLESSSELGAKANDIKRRLDAMEQMWKDGKLNVGVQIQMRDLAYALRDDTPKKADNIHRALMVNEVSSVGTWMPGVKQLIHHSIARSELLSIDRE